MKNGIQLITYVDRLTGGGIQELLSLCTGPLKDVFTGIHLLPFFHPIDGADAGFDPIDHTQVDPRLGDWNDVKALSHHVDIMGDIIVNHMSADSEAFQSVLKNGPDSPHWDLFLKMSDIFPEGATEETLMSIYRPRPGLPFNVFMIQNKPHLFWTTFTRNQIDINVQNDLGKNYLTSILDQFEQGGVTMIRLDAAGYAIKKDGSSCFMLPETFAFIGAFTESAHERSMDVLVEIHSYYQTQIDIAKRVDFVYDFALPPLVLHTLFTQSSTALKNWLSISPRNAITVLDTHDGIGVIDVGPDGDKPGLLEPDEIDFLVEEIHRRSNGQSKKATGSAASNLDLYQVNCTYFNALGADADLHYISRAIQFFAPGIPQVYYMGLLHVENDMELLAASNVGRDINRSYLDNNSLHHYLDLPATQKLLTLIRFRNTHPAFQGSWEWIDKGEQQVVMRWTHVEHYAELNIDLTSFTIHILSSTYES